VKSRVSRARRALQATLERGGYARDGKRRRRRHAVHPRRCGSSERRQAGLIRWCVSAVPSLGRDLKRRFCLAPSALATVPEHPLPAGRGHGHRPAADPGAGRVPDTGGLPPAGRRPPLGPAAGRRPRRGHDQGAAGQHQRPARGPEPRGDRSELRTPAGLADRAAGRLRGPLPDDGDRGHRLFLAPAPRHQHSRSRAGPALVPADRRRRPHGGDAVGVDRLAPGQPAGRVARRTSARPVRRRHGRADPAGPAAARRRRPGPAQGRPGGPDRCPGPCPDRHRRPRLPAEGRRRPWKVGSSGPAATPPPCSRPTTSPASTGSMRGPPWPDATSMCCCRPRRPACGPGPS
jgi:hypothetical protein